jgi:large-conductance mechanosensitive channel
MEKFGIIIIIIFIITASVILFIYINNINKIAETTALQENEKMPEDAAAEIVELREQNSDAMLRLGFFVGITMLLAVAIGLFKKVNSA